jgi:hypothetical protein
VVLYFTWDNPHGRFIGLSSTYFPASSTSQFPLVNYGIYYLSLTQSSHRSYTWFPTITAVRQFVRALSVIVTIRLSGASHLTIRSSDAIPFLGLLTLTLMILCLGSATLIHLNPYK